MIIKYTQTKSGGILINSIEDVLSWSEISSKFGESVKFSYIQRFPNMTYSENILFIYSQKTNGEVKEKRLIVGEEYDPTYFVKCKSLIIMCDARLKEIINYVEEEEVFDSYLYERY